jgi:hypothetical protein
MKSKGNIKSVQLKDPAGASSYARSAPNLSAAQRTQLLNSLGDGS